MKKTKRPFGFPPLLVGGDAHARGDEFQAPDLGSGLLDRARSVQTLDDFAGGVPRSYQSAFFEVASARASIEVRSCSGSVYGMGELRRCDTRPMGHFDLVTSLDRGSQ